MLFDSFSSPSQVVVLFHRVEMFKLRNIDGHHSLKHLEIVIVITIKIITNTITIKKY